MPELPSGTVTFLFTDIEGSTESAAALGDERWADVLQTHRGLLRPAFAKFGGAEIATEGDSFFVAFARAGDAANAAVEGQRALETYDWPGEARLRVRMGLHTGEALVRDNSYVGHEVHRAKRISDAGHGGQILVSQTTGDLVRSSCRLVGLGPHRLKDLGEPQQLFQLAVEGLQTDFPPLRSLEWFSHNLPLQRSTFVGRENEIAFVRKLLDEHRIVTLTGVGGCGKTRLALQVGAEVLDVYPDGVFFADLAPISEPSLVIGALAGAVGVPLAEGASGAASGPTDQLLIEFLARRNCLILLDNCEHLLDASADIADRILSTCPQVTILATSREGLEIEGERSFTVPSMSLPDDDQSADTSEAVSLFKARAAEVRPDFDLTPDNIGSVTAICRRLDGIPLAIEFAASRVSHLTPHEIDERLGASFRLLAGGRRRVQRQQTIAATLDWSHDLLAEPERVLLRRLAVFAGSFPLEAAEGVAAGDDLDSADVLDLLASLVAKSLVTADEERDRTRYRLLETVRLYAAEKLMEARESEAIHSRHRDWFLAWVESMPWDHVFTSTVVMNAQLADYANLTAALEWSAGEKRLDLVARMAARMYLVWSQYGDEGFRWTTMARSEDLDISVDVRVACLAAAAYSAVVQQSGDSPALGDRAIAAADGPSAPLAMALIGRALTRSVEAAYTRDPEIAARVRAELDESFEMAKELSPFSIAISNYGRGFAEITMGAFDRAVEPLETALRQMDPLHHLTTSLAAVSALTGLAHTAGDDAAAVRWADRAVDLLDVWPAWKSGVVATAAAAFAGAGDIAQAEDLLARWIDDIRRSGMPGSLEEVMIGVAAVSALKGDYARASSLLAWVRSRTMDRFRTLRSPVAYPIYLHYVRVVREGLGPDHARRAKAEGEAMSEDEAVAYALEDLKR